MADLYKSVTSDVVYSLTFGHQRVADIYKSVTSDVVYPLTFGHQHVAGIYKSVTSDVVYTCTLLPLDISVWQTFINL